MLRPLLLAFAVLVSSAGVASATTLALSPLKCSNSSSECGTLGSQLSIEVVSGGAGKVSFVLHNEGTESLTASQVFVDDNADVLLDLLDVTDGLGVDFAEGGKRENLKSGKKIDFIADYLASAAKPSKDNGVSPGETVQLNFTLASGMTLEDVLAALEDGSLRLGANAKQGFVTGNGTVPEPGTLLLLALGGAAGIWASRRS